MEREKEHYHDRKNVIALIKGVLRERQLSLTYLAKSLHVLPTALSDQLYFRSEVNEQLLQKILAFLNIELVLDNRISIDQEIKRLNYVKTGNPSRPLKRTSFAKPKEKRLYSHEIFYWKFDHSYNVGKNIRNLRQKLGLTREELKDKLDPYLPKEIIEKWEEQGYLPSLEYCLKLSKLGNIPLDTLLK